MEIEAVRHGGDRWGAGGPVRRVPPSEGGAILRDRGRERARRQHLAAAVRLAAPVHAGPLHRSARRPVPREGIPAMPTKDEMADYLESYAARFSLPVWTRRSRGARALRGRYVRDRGGRVHVRGVERDRRFGRPPRPSRAGARTRARPGDRPDARPSGYRNPSQLHDGGVLVVGAGNSGGDIAMGPRTHAKGLSGPDAPAHLPVDIDLAVARHVGVRVFVFGADTWSLLAAP